MAMALTPGPTLSFTGDGNEGIDAATHWPVARGRTGQLAITLVGGGPLYVLPTDEEGAAATSGTAVTEEGEVYWYPANRDALPRFRAAGGGASYTVQLHFDRGR